ncbi:MAG: repressor of RNA polymerase III transcription MAF1 [archaeon]|nr:repressor of RNA polymerase III transcription MAF1 [archaeon]
MALSPSGTTTSTSIELFSCAAGADKKLYKSLDTLHHQRSALTGSSSTAASTPSLRASGSGAPGEGASRALVFLIAVLNASFPDYDFSDIQADEFRHETNVYTTVSNINTLLLSLIPGFGGMKDALWKSLDEQIGLKDAEIYEFIPTLDSDPFRDMGAARHLCYFFYNPRSQRVLFWRCHSKRRRSQSLSDSGRILSRSVPASYHAAALTPGGGGGGSSSSSSFQDTFAIPSGYPPALDDDLDGFYSDSGSDGSQGDPYLLDDDSSSTFNVDI